MLTPEEKAKIREKAVLLNEAGLSSLAQVCAQNDRPDAAKYVRDLIAERKAFGIAASTPLEIAGERRTAPRPAQARPQAPILSPAASHALKHAALWVVVVGGGSAFSGLVVIPALVALGSAVAAMMTAIAPILAAVGGVVFTGWILISSLLQKKTDNPSAGPRVEYHQHFYFNQGENASQKNA